MCQSVSPIRQYLERDDSSQTLIRSPSLLNQTQNIQTHLTLGLGASQMAWSRKGSSDHTCWRRRERGAVGMCQSHMTVRYD